MSSLGRHRPAERGLTLMEVALAVSILAVIATLTWGSIARSFDAYEAVTEIDRRYHNVRVAMNRMAKELSMAFLTSPRRNRGRLDDAWITIFKSEPGSSFYKLHYTSFANEILRADVKESDQCELSYYVDDDPDVKGQMNLMRRLDPRLDPKPEEGGRSYVLAEDIKKFKLRFFDLRNDDWTDDWDTTAPEYLGRLPDLVEITLIVEDEEGREVKFVTKTRINLTAELGVL